MEIYNYYHRNLKGLADEGKIEQPFVPDGCTHNAHMYYLKVRNMDVRTRLLRYLRENGINSVFHYVPLPLLLQDSGSVDFQEKMYIRPERVSVC